MKKIDDETKKMVIMSKLDNLEAIYFPGLV